MRLTGLICSSALALAAISGHAAFADKSTEAEKAWDAADVATMRYESDCIAETIRTAEAVGFRERVFDDRFVFVERLQGAGFLIAFTGSCDATLGLFVESARPDRTTPRGFKAADGAFTSLKARSPDLGRVCRTQPISFAGETCIVDEIFEAPDEATARALAIKVQLAEDEFRTLKYLGQ